MVAKAKLRKKQSLRYAWKEKRGFTIDANTAKAEFDRIKSEHGELTPALVLEAAANDGNPLHPCEKFMWDDDAGAAHEHRLRVAGEMIRSIRVVTIDNDGNTSRDFVYVHAKVGNRPQYVTAKEIRVDASIRNSALAELVAQLEGLRLRYEFVRSAGPILAEAIDKLKRLDKAG